MNNFARPGLGATELPPVNSEDNGKVLGVSDGAWAKVAASGGSDLPDDPAQDGTYNLQNTVSSGTGTLSWASGGSGGGVLVATIVYDNGTIKTDKTWQEIHDAPLAVIKDPDKYFSNGKTLLFADYVSGNSRDGYSVIAYSLTGDSYDLWSETADGYPALVDNGGE